MYSHHIDKMVGFLLADGVINASQEQAAKTALKKEWVDQIAIAWAISDVQSVRKISNDDAREVLQKVLHKFDATVGVNWDVLEEWAQDYPIDPTMTNDEDD